MPSRRSCFPPSRTRLDELTLKVIGYGDPAGRCFSSGLRQGGRSGDRDAVRTETRKEDMRMIEDTKKWVLSPERKAPQPTREYAAHRLDTVLDKFLKTMQTTAARLQEKLLKPEVRQKGKEQVKEKARDSVSATAEPFAGRAGTAEAIGESHTAEILENRFQS